MPNKVICPACHQRFFDIVEVKGQAEIKIEIQKKCERCKQIVILNFYYTSAGMKVIAGNHK